MIFLMLLISAFEFFEKMIRITKEADFDSWNKTDFCH
jgi:hypothetical protein